MKQFNELGLSENVLRAVSAEGYTIPTPIQADVIPAILEGRDIVGIAQTGTGKTASFVLPLLERILKAQARTRAKCAGTLILTPTRELAAQIAQSINTYGRFVRHSKVVVVGGAKPGPQIKALARGVDIIIATPGRLEDHLSRGVLRLDQTTNIVLDEADQMMDLGFLPAIRRIMARLASTRQTILMSATMPRQIRKLAKDFLRDPVEITVTPGTRPIELIEQKVMFIDKSAKRQQLVNLLADKAARRVIVFTRTKHCANRVTTHLQKAGLDALAIHGNKSQSQRSRTLGAFRSGRLAILVATDVAARGIDVDDITHVINFELPNVPEVYIHRVGRTARAGKSGIAISLCDRSERKLLRDIERLIGVRIESQEPAAGDASSLVELEQLAGFNANQRRAAENTVAGEGTAKPARKAKKKNRPKWRSKNRSNRGAAHHGSATGAQNRHGGKARYQGKSKAA